MAGLTIAGSGPEALEVARVLRTAGVVESSVVMSGAELLVVGEGALDLLDRVAGLAARGRVLVVLVVPGADPWELLRAGAADVVRWRPGSDVMALRARLDRWSEVDALVDSDDVRGCAVGTARAWRELLREVVEVARFTTSSVLLAGETGTGKEVIARLIHALDSRPRRGELVLVDCTTVVPSLSGSEFFGHEKGAFTGASAARPGAFELADGGTLFLDEVGELPAGLQAELLRVVQEGAFKRVGSTRWQSTRFRLIAATNRELRREQEEGRFRRDLYFRLAAATIRVPPLADRLDDVVPLFRHFFAAARGDGDVPEIDQAVAELLLARAYPGNVRDLRQLAVRVAARHVGAGSVTPGDVPADDRPTAETEALRAAIPEQGWGLDRSAQLPRTEVGAVAGGPPPEAGDEAVSPEDWARPLEQCVRRALRSGTGLKELRAVVGEVATRVALEESGSAGEAARLLGVSRRAVEYRRASTSSRQTF